MAESSQELSSDEAVALIGETLRAGHHGGIASHARYQNAGGGLDWLAFVDQATNSGFEVFPAIENGRPVLRVRRRDHSSAG